LHRLQRVEIEIGRAKQTKPANELQWDTADFENTGVRPWSEKDQHQKRMFNKPHPGNESSRNSRQDKILGA